MTVVLATVCRDGVVLGSDSQITDKGRGMTYPAEKLHPLGDLAAWGGSGARSVLSDVKDCFNQNSAAILEAPTSGGPCRNRCSRSSAITTTPSSPTCRERKAAGRPRPT